jgi:AAT family amino acid transporter
MAVQDIEKQPPTPQEPEALNSKSPDALEPSAEYVNADRLARRLSARQVQMIAIGGTIGTGLFLGTGKALATGGPASMLIAYIICGGIVFVTMLCLGEMAAFIPVAGSFCTYAGYVSHCTHYMRVSLHFTDELTPS